MIVSKLYSLLSAYVVGQVSAATDQDITDATNVSAALYDTIKHLSYACALCADTVPFGLNKCSA
jgi:hypothetical protein